MTGDGGRTLEAIRWNRTDEMIRALNPLVDLG